MSEHTPSQAEGERDDETAPGYDPPWTTPSQAEGERDDETEEEDHPLADAPDRFARASGEEEPGAHSGGGSGPVTRDHVRALLAAREEATTLVLVEGRAEVVTVEERTSDRYAGAMDAISGEDLARRAGTREPAEQDVEALVGMVNTLVGKLGA
ncbi:hypothetical protein AB0D86_32830 [Streptomyces sp. NPDC048324]|uniref:hypothetical protein n=1 Tax=Streptomyces sp. NPDC048324 TaxID=3157205 RepID=UPI003446F25E